MASKIARDTKGVAHAISVTGLSFVLGANGSHLGSMFIILDPFEERRSPDLTADAIAQTLRDRLYKGIQEANVAIFGAAARARLGQRRRLQDHDRRSRQRRAGNAATADRRTDPNREIEQPGLVGLFTVFRANTPQLYIDIDRTKCKMMGVAMNDVFDALQVDLGGLYVNDFNQFGRTWQVNAQADTPFRMQPEDVRRLQVRNDKGQMVPLGAVAVVEPAGGPFVITRYNMYPAAVDQRRRRSPA